MGERQCSTEDLTITMYMRSYTKLQSGVSSVIRLDLERSKGILHTHANRQTERERRGGSKTARHVAAVDLCCSSEEKKNLTALMLVLDINATKDVKISVQTTNVSNHTTMKLFSRSSTVLLFTNSWTNTL